MFKQFDVFDEVVKKVIPFGNGSIVYTPKKWIGQTVTVILEKQPLSIKKKVVEELEPFLENVVGIFLFGSFARNESTRKSDIDVLVVTTKKLEIRKTGLLDFTLVEEKILRQELKGKDPFYFYSILQESVPILNERLLRELKEIQIKKTNFGWVVEEIESALKIVQEFLMIDKLQNKKKLDSVAVIYTLILRLKRIFLVKCVLEGKAYSNEGFKFNLVKNGLTAEQCKKFYGIFQDQRDEKKTKISVSVKETEALYKIAKKELSELKQAYAKWRQKISS